MKKIATEIVKVMTPFPFTVDISATPGEVLSLMDEHVITHAPVTENGQIKGLISKSTLLFAFEHTESDESQPQITIKEIYDSEPTIVDAHEKLSHVVGQMSSNHIHAVLVTHRGKLAGIFTATDAYNLLVRLLNDQPLIPGPPNITA